VAQPWNPVAAPQPLAFRHVAALPPGYGCVVVSMDGGFRRYRAVLLNRLQVDGHGVAISGLGIWYIPVPAGLHDVRFVSPLGLAVLGTQLVIRPGLMHFLSFVFGYVHKGVYDANGRDVTRIGR
jgi:hypothetical protein